MRAGALFGGIVCALLLALAAAIPAAAKPPMVEAYIAGPGLREGGLRISGPAHTAGMLASGIDLFGHLDNAMTGAVAELGLTAAELGPRCIVTYRFDTGPSKPPGIVRQELYPYAKGGPVTYTPPGQRVLGQAGMSVTAGWCQSSPRFFAYLVHQGLPESNPVTAADRASTSDAVPAVALSLWRWLASALVGAAILSLRLRGSVDA